MRDEILSEQRPARIQAIYQRAHDHGENDLRRIPPTVLAMPFDLLMDLEAVKTARIESIVDDPVPAARPALRVGRGRLKRGAGERGRWP
ncbi:hypothetical protein [Actinomadura geliboluensis]